MPQRQAILSASDEYQLTAALLVNRKQRSRQGRFIVQSVKAVESAIANGWVFDSVWTPRGRRLSAWASSVIERSGARRHVELAPELFAQLAEKDEPGSSSHWSSAARARLPELPLGPRPLVVVLDRPSSPGNLGSIIRSADAFAADAVVVTGHAADLYDPQAVRASLGAIFAIPVRAAPRTGRSGGVARCVPRGACGSWARVRAGHASSSGRAHRPGSARIRERGAAA